MTYEEILQDFFERYDKPFVEKFTVGFSGIDPPKKVFPDDIDHELLKNLLGGNDNTGHYHLTKTQIEKLRKLIDDDFFPPKINPNQTFYIFPEQSMTPYQVQGENISLT